MSEQQQKKGKLGAFLALTILCVMAVWTLRAGGGGARSGRDGRFGRDVVLASSKQTAPSTDGAATAPMMGGATTSVADALAFTWDGDLVAQAKVYGYSYPAAPKSNRSKEQMDAFNSMSSCTGCHTGYTTAHQMSMHPQNVSLTCTDCHGGDAKVEVPRNYVMGSDGVDNKAFEKLKMKAHPKPRHKEMWETSANPQIPAAKTLSESPDYIRFVNPGDINGAFASCMNCHESTVRTTRTSMMAHGAMLWGAALYNNGAHPRKNAVYGEAYTVDGVSAKILPTTWPSSPNGPTKKDVYEKGHLPFLLPLPRWNITQPGNILRVFERGGRRRPNLGVPDPEEDDGRPEVRLSIRGVGTDLRTDPVYIGLHKTRLFDPTLNMFGTNDQAGDYRASGCSACHVVYANDRSPVSASSWSKFGNQGKSINPDPTVSKEESGHPVEHKFTSGMPSSQCIVCHVHPGTNVVNSYLGFQWWDNETDGKHMYPAKQKDPSEEDRYKVNQHNPEESAARGLWGNLYPNDKSQTGKVAGENFRDNLTDINPDLKRTQFADFHGHGWIFRAVFKQDRHGNLLDVNGDKVQDVTAEKMASAVAFTTTRPSGSLPPAGQPVHLKDIHLERGMQCADCHFSQDVHGDGNLYGETRAAVMVDCVDCHGSDKEPAKIYQYLKLANRDRSSDQGKKLLLDAFSGAAAKNGMTDADISQRNKEIIARHFNGRLIGDKLVQISAEKNPADNKPVAQWNTVQYADTYIKDSWWAKDVSDDKNKEGGTHKASIQLARFAHTVRKDGKTWGAPPKEGDTGEMALAHSNSAMSCYACHTSWTTACFGCHIPQRANQRKDVLHSEGETLRNYTNYNFQTLRDDVFMLGIDSTVKGGKIVPVRSSCAILVSSKDALRQWIYTQQQTVSAEGYAGTAFSVYFPHTVRGVETKQCNDCHVSKDNDNNAWMANITLQGSNSVNFIGRYAYVATGEAGYDAVAVTEREEPQAVIGSRLHEIAYPKDYENHLARGMKLDENYPKEHHEVLDLQQRGEYLYAACGKEGFIAFDIANMDNKGFSERNVTAPVSPLGQRFYVKTKYATSVTSPSTLAVDPTRPHFEENQEQALKKPIHLMYGFLYVTDKYEGLVVIGNKPGSKAAKENNIGVATLLDGNPENNFLSRATQYNPDGVLNDASSMTIYGTYGYITTPKGVSVIDLDNPLEPKLVTTLAIPGARKVAFQFRYGWVATDTGLVTLDVSDPRMPTVVDGASMAIPGARDIFVSRTYGYVAAGSAGIAIVDLEKPAQPRLVEMYTGGGAIVDAHQVRIGMTNASMFAYVADGVGGLKVLQLTSPEDDANFGGYSPRPHPRLIAMHETDGPALALSKGLERDRAVDESGNQLAVFGRRGARPFNLEEQQRLWMKTDASGNKVPYFVSNEPDSSIKPLEYEPPKPPAPASAPSGPSGPRRPGLPRR